MSFGLGGYGGGFGPGYGAGFGPGYGGGFDGCCGVSPVAVSPIATGCGGGFTTAGVILVLFILLVIISRSFI